jgi:hypothetical protein
VLEHLAQSANQTESAINVLRVFWLFIGLSFMLALGALFIRLVRRSVQRRLDDGPKRTKTEYSVDAWEESARRLRDTRQQDDSEDIDR